jgi:cytochrome c-type biogenesis protein CcmH/NrfF
LLCLALSSLRANPANGDPRLEKLFPQFIAPCCWRENLLAHHSPKADEMRSEIKRLVDKGRSDEEVKAAFIEQYSIRILALPEGARGRWLAWTPVLAAFAGLGVVLVTIRRWSAQQGSPQ